MRAYLAVLIAFVVGTAVAAVLIAVLRLVRPDGELARRGRLPDWWQRFTGWSRSRSLRLWSPDEHTALRIARHLQTGTGRRLSRLGVSVAPGPWAADAVVVERAGADRLDAARARAPHPVATIVLTDAADPDEFRDAVVALAAALRWPDERGTA